MSNKGGARLIPGEDDIELRLQAHAKCEAASSVRDERSHRWGGHRNASIGLRDARLYQPIVSKREKIQRYSSRRLIHDHRVTSDALFCIDLQRGIKVSSACESGSDEARKCRTEHTLSPEICRMNSNLKCLFLSY
jgi:hypothetical protein